MFCSKCGSVMNVKNNVFVCSCGYIQKVADEKIKDKIKQSRKVELMDDTVNPVAVHDHKCKKCGFEKAQLISKGIWYSDEDEVLEYVCGKCGYHDRAEGLRVK